MPQSRFNRLKNKMNQRPEDKEIPKKISDTCLGKCAPDMFGFNEDGSPKIYCHGCGRNLGK
ncbi:MAG: hypothetical protein SLAVMIC_00503 [uncultured marine phage]|uniref:Uncharacterized protein n=1 Tax=uncultured marine phage TaxID=707152 RepID=A0A8D9CD60_9VIRU|nr:MAG: hypothetical protein SLAVMIC_00503 [uncultured marine phage]